MYVLDRYAVTLISMQIYTDITIWHQWLEMRLGSHLYGNVTLITRVSQK